MTQVIFTKYRESLIFECLGHTGYGERGADILCSAVSCLCYTLDAYLKEAEQDGRLSRLFCEFSDGKVSLCFEPKEEDPEGLSEAVRAILGGFQLLEETYPGYITCEFDCQFAPFCIE